MGKKLNRKKPFDQVLGDPDVAFIQNKEMYSRMGDYIRPCPEAFLAKGKGPVPLEEAREDALARAAEMLGLNDDVAPRIPQEVIDANRENAAALAAEDNA